MAQVHINEQASGAASQPQNTVVTDAKGRALTLKRPNALAQYRLVDALGHSAENRVYLTMCIPLIYLEQIDGEQVMQPTTKRELEALIQRLDDAGLAAIKAGMEEHFTAEEEDQTKRAKK